MFQSAVALTHLVKLFSKESIQIKLSHFSYICIVFYFQYFIEIKYSCVILDISLCMTLDIRVIYFSNINFVGAETTVRDSSFLVVKAFLSTFKRYFTLWFRSLMRCILWSMFLILPFVLFVAVILPIFFWHLQDLTTNSVSPAFPELSHLLSGRKWFR